MICKEVITKIEQSYPKSSALEWDNVGLLVGRDDKEVERIYIALDATDEVIKNAVSKNADLLITHHPMIFAPLRKITNEHFIGNRVVQLLRHDISYYAMHTNYDVLGMADLAAGMIGLSNDVEMLEVTSEFPKPEGIGRVGLLNRSMTLGSCCQKVKERFGILSVKVFGDLRTTVHRVAISPGSGKIMIKYALQKGADVLITGDIDHHEGIDAVAQGLSIIDAGHYGIEHIFIEDIKAFAAEHFPDIEVETEPIQFPFQVV